MRLGLLAAGGTLDCEAGDQGLTVGEASRLPGFVRTLLGPEDELVELTPPWRMDSSQFRFEDAPPLAEAAFRAEADALLIGTGTDTLAFLAPCLWALGVGDRPVFLVSGMVPWWCGGSDGAASLRDAVRLARAGVTGLRVVSGGRVLRPVNLRKISHLARDPFRELALPDVPGRLLVDLFTEVAGTGSPLDVPGPALPSGAPLRAVRIPQVAWLPAHPGLLTSGALAVAASVRHLVLSGYAGGTFPRQILSELPEGACLHLVSQQWGPLRTGDYAASADLPKTVHPWNLTAETVLGVLAACDMAGLTAADAVGKLRALERMLSPR